MTKLVGILLFAIVVVVLVRMEVKIKLKRDEKTCQLTIENKKKLKKMVEDFFLKNNGLAEGSIYKIAEVLKVQICRTEADVGKDFVYGAAHSDGWRYQYVPLYVSSETEKECLALACAKTMYPWGTKEEWEYIKLLLLVPDYMLDGSKPKDIAKVLGLKTKIVVDRIAAA